MRTDYLKKFLSALKILILVGTLTCWAQDEEPQEVSPPPVPTEEASSAPSAADLKTIDNEEVLPDIQAKKFQTQSERRSKSLRVYLFTAKQSDPPVGLPRVGKIILLTHTNESVMAFRVLKTYPDRHQFAASRVRMYGKNTLLDLGAEFDAIEKMSEIKIPVYTTRDKLLDKADLAEIESQMPPVISVPKYDSELDKGTSPPPGDNPIHLDKKSNQRALPAEGSPEEDNESLTVDDIDEEEIETITPDQIKNYDPDHQWLSLQVGYLVNSKPSGDPVYYTGMGLRYGVTLAKNIFTHSNSGQDSFALEGGVFYYNVLGYLNDGDSYTVMPLVGTLRYNLMLSEGFGLFGYAGLLRNNVVNQSGGTPDAVSTLSSFGYALGGGMLFRLGPKWFVRADLGFEMIAVGLTLRF